MGNSVHLHCDPASDLRPCPLIDSDSFQKSFRRFISCRGCPSNVISDPGSNFNTGNTQAFVNNLEVTWHTDLPLASWHVFFERLVRST